MGNPGDTQYTNCCNDVSYDRRFYSCPCHDGSLKPVPEGDSRCCVSRFDHSVKTGYDFESEICSASGQVGKMSENMICGDYLIKIPDSYEMTAVTELNQEMTLECCHLGDKQYQVFDKNYQYCCNSQVRTKTTESEKCCETQNFEIYSTETDVCCEKELSRGDSCHLGYAFNSKYQIVCNDELFDKLSGQDLSLEFNDCCGEEPFLNVSKICCEGVIHEKVDQETGVVYEECCGSMPFDKENNVCCGGKTQGPFEWPACCGDFAFDARTDTCCGDETFPNPKIENILTGTTSISQTTRCCNNGTSWTAYDYKTQVCCNSHNQNTGGQIGSVINLLINGQSGGECCGTNFAGPGELCCKNKNRGIFNIMRNLYGEAGSCCGSGMVYDSMQNICCEPNAGNLLDRGEVNDSFESGSEVVSGCCGGTAYDYSTQICCGLDETNNPDIRELNGVDPEFATCCGDTKCIDMRDYWCCGGEMYSKGNSENSEFECPFGKPGGETTYSAKPPVNITSTQPPVRTECQCEWSEWSSCSKTCGGIGQKTRYRNNCQPSFCQSSEEYNMVDTRDCDYTEPCSCSCEWSAWSTCSTTCGAGSVSYRTFDNCYTNEGAVCENSGMNSQETRSCCGNSDCGVCPGEDTCVCTWSEWENCSTTCDSGLKSRTRACKTSFSEETCFYHVLGEKPGDSDTLPCNFDGTSDCPGNWSKWSSWDTCSETCNGGQQERTRMCKSGFTFEGCPGDSREVQFCNDFKCPVETCVDAYFDLTVLIHSGISQKSEEFSKIIEFLNEVQTFFPSPPSFSNWRMAVSSFNCDFYNYFSLVDGPDSYLVAEDMLKYEVLYPNAGDNCNTGADYLLGNALRRVVNEQMTEQAGRRLPSVDPILGIIDSGVPGTVLIILDDTESPNDDFHQAVLDLKELSDKIIVIGIGEFDPGFLQAISSKHNHFEGGKLKFSQKQANHYTIESHADLLATDELVESVIYQICDTEVFQSQCMNGNGGCDHFCRTEYSGKQCYCESGYGLMKDGMGCSEDFCEDGMGKHVFGSDWVNLEGKTCSCALDGKDFAVENCF